MQRVSVIGNASSGKSTVARALAARIGVPYVELDALHWGPRWSQATADELRARVEPMLSADAWVIDGMYWRKLGGAVLRRADTVIWVDPPFATMFLRLLRRSLTRIVRRTPLYSGNRESFRQSFFSRESVLLFALVRFASAEDALRWVATQPRG